MGREYKIIASSSKGNCIIVDNSIALDMGIPFKLISKYVKQLKLVFISHEHTDHLFPKTIKRLAFERPTLKFAVGSYLVDKLINLGVNPKNIFVIDTPNKYDLGAIEVEPFEVSHDVKNQGFKIRFKKDNFKILYIVDTSNIDNIVAPDYNLYLVECNYNQAELEERITKKRLNGEYTYEDRVINTHLSEEQWNEFMLKNAGDNSECVKIHQHIDKE